MMKNQQLIKDISNRLINNKKCIFCEEHYLVNDYSSAVTQLDCNSCKEHINIWFEHTSPFVKVASIFISCNNLSYNLACNIKYNNIGPIIYRNSGGWHSIVSYNFEESPINYQDIFDKKLLYNKLRTYLIFS